MGGVTKEIRTAFRNDWPILAVVAITWVVSASLLASKGISPFRWISYLNNFKAYGFWFGLYLIYRMARITLEDRPEFPVRHFIAKIREENWPARILANLPLVFALVIFMPIFSAMKSAIPLFQDFTWDPVFIELDRTIHGTDPWLLLQPVLGYPAITAVLSGLYTAWVLLIYIGSLYFAFFARSEAVRQRYFLTYFLAWSVLGILGAIYLASMGPCFLHILGKNETFVQQMLYLQLADDRVPIISVEIQEILVRAYYAKQYELGSGITAMPSMHVALCTLFFLGMCKQGRTQAIVFGVYGLVILVSSVHLGFHYAVDGYASIIGVSVLWWISGRVLRYLGHPSLARGAAPAPGISDPRPALGREHCSRA